MATTAGGTYYAASTETLTAYPALSLNLANQLESRLAAKLAGVKADTAPATPATNDVWLDTSGAAGVWKIWNGSAWVSFSGAAVLTAADVSSTTGSPTITTSGIYTIYKFTGSGTIVLGKAGLCDVLVQGGGGVSYATGTYCSGGGAGGLIAINAYLAVGTNTCTVGAGGATDGGNSVLGSLFAIGGGFGNSSGSTIAGNKGGCGSGGSGAGRAAGLGIPGQGFDGALVASGFAAGGGTGGVASGATGGIGTASSITGSSVTYGVGGASATSNTANSGNGGGGSNNGNSGVVIVRVVT